MYLVDLLIQHQLLYMLVYLPQHHLTQVAEQSVLVVLMLVKAWQQ